MWICFFSWMCELTLHVVYWQCYELLNTIYLSLFSCLLPIYSWESQTCEKSDNLMSMRCLLSFFSLLSEETSWTNKSQAWKNERGNDRYVLKKVLMPFTRYLHLLNIVCITYPLHHVSLAITMNTMYKCTSCQSHQIVSLLNFWEIPKIWSCVSYDTITSTAPTCMSRGCHFLECSFVHGEKLHAIDSFCVDACIVFNAVKCSLTELTTKSISNLYESVVFCICTCIRIPCALCLRCSCMCFVCELAVLWGMLAHHPGSFPYTFFFPLYFHCLFNVMAACFSFLCGGSWLGCQNLPAIEKVSI